MIDRLNQAINDYFTKWESLQNGRKDPGFFASLQPTAVGWKVENREEYDRIVAELHDNSDLITEKWMNERWIAKVHLKDVLLANGIEVVKIMQRRPGSSDAVGIDHVDFYTPEIDRAEVILKAEPELNWSWESNDVKAGYDWLSIWFDGTEAKIKGNTVLDIVSEELQDLNRHLIGKKK